MATANVVQESRLFRALVAGFVAQVAGRLVDLGWHVTHDEFEGAAQQLEAHWLIWISTAFVLIIAALALRDVREEGQRRGYAVVLAANLAYAAVAVIHFLQHLDHLEVDWTHLVLAVTSVAAVLGVVWVVAARFRSGRRKNEAIA